MQIYGDYDAEIEAEVAAQLVRQAGPRGNVSVYINTLTDRNATVASAEVVLGRERIQVTGSSKRERFDKFNREVGELYSTARALQNLVYELEARAKVLVEADIPDAHERQIRFVLNNLSKARAAYRAQKKGDAALGSTAAIAAVPDFGTLKVRNPAKPKGGKGGKGKKK